MFSREACPGWRPMASRGIRIDDIHSVDPLSPNFLWTGVIRGIHHSRIACTLFRQISREF